MFYRFGNDWILRKYVRLKQKSMKTKNYIINYARYTMLKHSFFLMVYVRTCDCYENIEIKL